MLARSFGVPGLRAEKAGDVKPLPPALRHAGPVVVDIPIDYAENEKLAIDLWKLAPGALA